MLLKIYLNHWLFWLSDQYIYSKGNFLSEMFNSKLKKLRNPIASFFSAIYSNIRQDTTTVRFDFLMVQFI